jgi:hypothetical protein
LTTDPNERGVLVPNLNTTGRVKFIRYGRKADYLALGEYNKNGIYFIDDSKEIIMGENPYGMSIEFCNALPPILFQNKLYIILNNGALQFYYYDGSNTVDLLQKIQASIFKELTHAETIIGDGNQTDFTVKHEMNTEDVQIQVRDLTDKGRVYVQDFVIDADNIKISFTIPPKAEKKYRVTVTAIPH